MTLFQITYNDRPVPNLGFFLSENDARNRMNWYIHSKNFADVEAWRVVPVEDRRRAETDWEERKYRLSVMLFLMEEWRRKRSWFRTETGIIAQAEEFIKQYRQREAEKREEKKDGNRDE